MRKKIKYINWISCICVVTSLCFLNTPSCAQVQNFLYKNENGAPDGYFHGMVSSWAQKITKNRQWEKYPFVNAVMLDESMEWWKPKGNSYTFDWTSIDSDINYITGLNRKFAIHINYDFPNGYGYSAETRQGADWIYEKIAAAGAPFDGVGGARPRGEYPAWYWHNSQSWPWKEMYGWLIKEEAYHLRTTFPGKCIYVRGQFNAVDPENMGSAGAKDVAMADSSNDNYAAWCASTFASAFMNEDPAFWEGRNVSKLSKANRIQVMFKPKDGVENMMVEKGFGVFLTHGSPDPYQYEPFEKYCRDLALPGADETSGLPEMSDPQKFYAQHWYHLMALHSGFTTVAMRSGQITIPGNPAVSKEIKMHFNESVDFVNKYLGYLHYPAKSPGGWIAFRQPAGETGKNKKSYVGQNAGNWNFHITQNGTEEDINRNNPGDNNIGDLYYGLYSRKIMAPILLNINDSLFGGKGEKVKILITAFAKEKPATLKFTWQNGTATETKILFFNKIDDWETQALTIQNIAFNKREDLIIELVSGNCDLHMVEIQKQ